MRTDEIEYFIKFNELPSSSPRRVLLRFQQSYAVILLNDIGSSLIGRINELEEKTFTSTDNWLKLHFRDLKIGSEIPSKQKSWVLYYDGTHLLIPTKKSKTKIHFPELGIVITGKQYIPDTKILSVEVLTKSQPTPFIQDEWHDSFNDSFLLEPRIIESYPWSVFKAVNVIMSAGNLAFKQSNFDVAASKYQKAFHYCHSYYPEHLNEDDLNTATHLKIHSLLNLSLAAIKTNDRSWWSQGIEGCEFVLSMPESTDTHKAKALYRLGHLYMCLGDDIVSIEKLKESLRLLDDPATRVSLEKAIEMQNRRKALLRSTMKNAFR